VKELPAALLAAMLTASCGTTPLQPVALDPLPRTILVLAPHNATDAPGADLTCHARITRPLTEHGYWVVPVGRARELASSLASRTDLTLDDGLRGELHRASAADAILQVTVEVWDRDYLLFDDVASVAGRMRLVDAVSGQELWAARYGEKDSLFLGTTIAGSAGGPTGLMFALMVAPPFALVSAIARDTDERLANLVQRALDRAIRGGLPPGPMQQSVGAEPPAHGSDAAR
jgi:hypothetical protein